MLPRQRTMAKATDRCGLRAREYLPDRTRHHAGWARPSAASADAIAKENNRHKVSVLWVSTRGPPATPVLSGATS